MAAMRSVPRLRAAGEHLAGIPVMDADGLEAAIFDGAKQAAHAIDERLAADKADMGVVLRLPDQMLARAEADLKPHLTDRDREDSCQARGRGPIDSEAQLRQQHGQELLFPPSQGAGFAPAIGPDRSIERASIGRRTSEALIDCVNLIIPGHVDLISADKVRPNLDMPRADELIAAISDFLRTQVMTETEGRTSFLARVSANSLDIIGREFDLLGEHRRREHAGLQAFYQSDANDPDSDLETLRWRLVHALRDGSQRLDNEALTSLLRNTVVNQVAIDQPRYSGFQQYRQK